MGDLPFLEQEAMPEAETEQVELTPEVKPEPEAKGEPPAAPPAEAKEERHIPITALLDEREKRQAKEREAEELRRQLAALRQPQERREFFDDPDAHIAALQRQAQQLALQTKLEMSRAYAEDKFGAETVSAAFEYFNQHPEQSHALLNTPMPFVEAVKVYQRAQAMQEIGDDPASYRTRLEAEIRERILAELGQQTKPKTPPPSIATAPSAAGKTTGTGGFSAIFGE